MKIQCPHNHTKEEIRSISRILSYVKNGSFYRQSDRKKVQRFRCLICQLSFSVATFSKAYYQKKRHLNHKIARLLVSGVSQREAQRILKVNRKTIVNKFIFMGNEAQEKLTQEKVSNSQLDQIQFDDLETFEHTKCKPLSVTLAVDEKTRRILDFQVSQMSAKGLLASISRKKYGPRADVRGKGRRLLFHRIRRKIKSIRVIKSDENPHYRRDVERYFPESEYIQYKGRRGSIVGQGELKKIGFDPLFSLNHTCAVLRARVNRLIRRTWCTTKKPERLSLHIALVARHHNLNLQV